MKQLFLLVCLLAASLAQAQNAVGPVSITSSQCATISTQGRATVAILVSGTWTGTLQPQVIIQGQSAVNAQVTPSTSTTSQSTITANGAFTAVVSGYDTFQVCGNTVASGTATIYLNGATVSSVGRATPAGGGAGLSSNNTFTGTNTFNQAVTAPSFTNGVARRVTSVLSGVGGTNGSLTTSGAASEVAVRNISAIPVTPTRYRFRIRNYSVKQNLVGGGPLTGTGIWIGSPAYNASGDNRWIGNFSGAPTQVVNAFTLDASANEFVSAWVTNTTAITARVPFVVSTGYSNAGGGGAVAVYSDAVGGISFIGVGASTTANATGAPSSLTPNKWSYFDTRLEYEYTTAVDGSGNPAVPVGVFVGDSITLGMTGLATADLGQHETYPGSAGLARGFAAINMGVNSAKTSDWLNVNSVYWTRFDLATTVPDFGAILIGINDVTTSVTAATMEANILTIIGELNTLGVTKVYLGTILPDGWNSPISVGGSTVTNTSKTVTVGTTLGLAANMPITGTGIPASTTITSIDSPTQVTISAAGTATNAALTLSAGATGVPTAAQEAVRLAVNQWIRSLPDGVIAVWDFDKALAVSAMPGTADPAYISIYPHPDPGGYQRMAQIVRF